ncbi:MAG: hypothetical protein K0S30_1412 [Clostridia bacterium]|jgi:uncharacterized protein YjgD (DUF1641 family)|nr:hypothetical protein [Clostridia bacterium]
MENNTTQISARFTDKTAEAIWQEAYGKPLNCKKHILEYIDVIKLLSKEQLTGEQLETVFTHIESSISQMSDLIKANTILQLKKELMAKLGKFRSKNEKVFQNHFLKFFTEAYPKNKRYKEYTWVLMDLSKINDDQILHTLKYINAWCLKDKLSPDEKKDILPMIEKLIQKGHLKYINQVKSLEGINKAFHMRIVEHEGRFTIKFNVQKRK